MWKICIFVYLCLCSTLSLADIQFRDDNRELNWEFRELSDDVRDGGKAYRALDYQKAFKLYKKIAKKGYGFQQYSLAEMYEKGFGVEKNLVEAKKWYDKAREQGVTSPIQIGEKFNLLTKEKIKREKALTAAFEIRKTTPEYKQQQAINRITDAKFRINSAQEAIDYENRIGARTGYVNKSRIYEAGSYLIGSEDILKQSYKDYKRAGGKLKLDAIKSQFVP